ncbi:MAG: hypothetical protein B1H40_03415 [Candidatus Latescibacteria bacterium 4484_181]|nr:MAG: hypothetical protein B1H40_03415 [Candidatus Latescibacteria bacterium 4484_181]
MLDKGGVRFINDTYNANPDSTKAALQLLISLEVKPQGRRIAVRATNCCVGRYVRTGRARPTGSRTDWPVCGRKQY